MKTNKQINYDDISEQLKNTIIHSVKRATEVDNGMEAVQYAQAALNCMTLIHNINNIEKPKEKVNRHELNYTPTNVPFDFPTK